jgi:PIN domain nuclease of toxin-antitoxin system
MELGLKWRKGKIALSPRRILKQAITNGLRVLAIHQEALLLSCEWRSAITDPFDRVLYAQAKHGGFRLLTIDRKLTVLGAAIITPK